MFAKVLAGLVAVGEELGGRGAVQALVEGGVDGRGGGALEHEEVGRNGDTRHSHVARMRASWFLPYPSEMSIPHLLASGHAASPAAPGARSRGGVSPL